MTTTKGRRSTIDMHPDRARIEREIALGTPLQRIAKKYDVSRHALHWHKHHKMPSHFTAKVMGEALNREGDLEKLRVEESEGLLGNLAAQRARLLMAQDKAMARNKLGLVAQLSAQIHANLRLVGGYLGEFAQHQVRTNVSILIQPEYLELRSGLIRALQSHPQARNAITEVFSAIERKAAHGPLINASHDSSAPAERAARRPDA